MHGFQMKILGAVSAELTAEPRRAEPRQAAAGPWVLLQLGLDIRHRWKSPFTDSTPTLKPLPKCHILFRFVYHLFLSVNSVVFFV